MFMKHNSKQFGKQFYINPSNFVIELALIESTMSI